MDDLEFRRRVYADPKSQAADLLDKENESQDNRLFVEDLQQFDEKIKQAMSVEPPEGLAQRIILNQALNNHTQSKLHRRYMLSMAASFLLVLGLFSYILQPVSGIDLEREVFAHVYEELNHLNEQQGKDTSQFNEALKKHGGKFLGDFGKINYLGSCNIVNKKGVHLILAGSQGAVTVMMLPEIKVSVEQVISDDRFHGSIIPTGKGSIAVVGEKGESLKEIKQVLENNFDWVI